MSEIELLCGAIYDHGERYDDGTAAIEFGRLFNVRIQASTIPLLSSATVISIVDVVSM